MESKKKHYSDRNGENVIHMYTPFTFEVGADYDYRCANIIQTVLYYILHLLVLLILYPYLIIANGLMIRGREHAKKLRGKGVVVIPNHVHIMDAPMIACALGIRRVYFVTTASNFCIPVIRHLIRWLGAIPITDSPAQIKRMFDEMEHTLSNGKAVAIYPEGVLLPYCENIRTFKRGAFKMAADASAPLLPVKLSFRAPNGIWKLLRRKPFVTLEFMQPIYPDESLPLRERSAKAERECHAAMSGS